MKDIWIHDTQTDEMINLAKCHGICKSDKLIKDDKFRKEDKYLIHFSFKKLSYVLHYKSEKLRNNAFLYFKKQLGAKDFDASDELLTL
jgi:hypothetical protein